MSSIAHHSLAQSDGNTDTYSQTAALQMERYVDGSGASGFPNDWPQKTRNQQTFDPSGPATVSSIGSGSIDSHSHVNGPRASSSIIKSERAGVAKGQAVRRRISRACDQCNQLRTKCDGKHPCAHCVELSLECNYARQRKKRGKASKKDLAAQGAEAEEADSKDNVNISNDGPDDDTSVDNVTPVGQRGVKRKRTNTSIHEPQLPPIEGNGAVTGNLNAGLSNYQPNPVGTQHDQAMNNSFEHRGTSMGLPPPRFPAVGSTPTAMSDLSSIDDYHRSVLHPGPAMNGQNILHNGPTPPNTMIHGGTITGFGESSYGASSPNAQQTAASAPYRTGESPNSGGFIGQSPMAASTSWQMPSPNASFHQGLHPGSLGQALRYPVLSPVIPYISAIMPVGLACDLLELYFSSTSSVFLQPQSPYILGYVFRKRSFLRENNARQCTPALLASMLWVAAQTSESSFLSSSPSARARICQKLLELTVSLLRPLIHTDTGGAQGYGANSIVNGVALGGFGVALPGQGHDIDKGSPGASGALDDVATYIHLATVVSASEYKAASLRWWSAAWTLARELKLGRELPPSLQERTTSYIDGQIDNLTDDVHAGDGTDTSTTSNAARHRGEEEKEERRRIWWLLYAVDRHLALCYNRPLNLLDAECEGLTQPESDPVWQAGEYYTSESRTEASQYRLTGPTVECTGHSMFGFFLPLMTILGGVVDLNHARHHPRYGARYRSGEDWDGQVREISQQLETYGRSLRDFGARNAEPELNGDVNGPRNPAQQDHNSPQNNQDTGARRMSESTLQTRIVVAYGTYLMHTLHVLVFGKWDPIELLDDNDLWISSPQFVSATGHAVSAAEALDDILELDPDFSYMPFFAGIYLLQGSFLLLLIADKLQGEASASIVKASETIVRAHEACVVTLNTEYQRNFRKVMRSALAQVRGRLVEDFGEQQQRRREVLSLYRWMPGGSGLAL